MKQVQCTFEEAMKTHERVFSVAAGPRGQATALAVQESVSESLRIGEGLSDARRRLDEMLERLTLVAEPTASEQAEVPECVVYHHAGHAVVMDGSGTRVLSLPEMSKCLFKDALEFLDALPDSFGLIADRQAGRFRIFKLEGDQPPEARQRLIVKG